MATVPTEEPISALVAEALENRFRRLESLWTAETGHLSSTTKIVDHPAFQEILTLGPAVDLTGIEYGAVVFDNATATNCPVADMIDLGTTPSLTESTMIEQLTGLPDHAIGFKISGKLHDEDYKTFVPLVDAEVAKEGKINMLVQFHDFHGWDAKALWADIKFATTHCTKIKRIAMVGETSWQKWMAAVCKPFTMAKVSYFPAEDLDAAKAWLVEPN